MIRHLFKLVWNRKRANLLMFSELLVSFLVLCAVATAAVYFIGNALQPLGFSYDDVWQIQVRGTNYYDYVQLPESGKQAIWDRMERLRQELENKPQIEDATFFENLPYSYNSSTWSFNVGDDDVEVLWGEASVQARQVLGLHVVAGRWFEAQDGVGTAWRPIVVSQGLARKLFPGQDAVGQGWRYYDDNGVPRERTDTETDYRIVGVLQDYRRDGELSQTPYSAYALEKVNLEFPPRNEVLVKLRPGVPAAFEEEVMALLRGVAPDWTFEIAPLAQRRAIVLRDKLLPVLIAVTIALFLLIMVALGLVGVLWLNVTRRTQELGLRRAVGATAAGVRLQILGEILALTTVAVLVGALLFLQAPLLGLQDLVSVRILVSGLVASITLLYILVLFCSWYPGWLATRIHPARALQYE